MSEKIPVSTHIHGNSCHTTEGLTGVDLATITPLKMKTQTWNCLLPVCYLCWGQVINFYHVSVLNNLIRQGLLKMCVVCVCIEGLLILNAILMGFITMETNLWACLWGIIYKLIEAERPTLNIDRSIWRAECLTLEREVGKSTRIFCSLLSE